MESAEERTGGISTEGGDLRTGGGAVIGGSVSVDEGGVFAGRDHIVYNVKADVDVYLFSSAEAFDRYLRQGIGPYKYLNTYDTEDTAIYYGREAAVQQVLNRLQQQDHLVLSGQPGVGKSSLINAGLMPPLLRDGWLVLRVKRYSYPTEMLRLALNVEQIGVSVAEAADLTALVRIALGTTGQPLTIIFDQFEGFLLNLRENERERFVEEFARCHSLDWGGRLRFLFAVRNDFFTNLGATFQEQVPNILNNSYVLKPMTRQEARFAILEPMQGRAVSYDRDFVDQVLLAHLDDQDEQRGTIYPPHLQIVCQKLYDAAREQQTSITVHLYRSLGEAKGILSDYLEGELTKLDFDEQKAAQAALKEMVSAHGTRLFRSTEELSDTLEQDAQELEASLEKLVTARLLEVRREEGVTRFSLSHEYMVSEVQSWYDEKEWNRRRAKEMLDRVWADWTATERLLVEPHRLAWLRRVRSDLTLTPDQLCLLLRSAVEFEREPAYWVGQMAADEPTQQVLEQIAEGLAEEAVADQAMQALGMIDGQEQEPPTLPQTVVAHTDGSVRRTAALALASLGGDDALKALRPHLQDGFDPRLRALWGLAHMRAVGVATAWPSLLAIPLETLMLGWIRFWAGRARLAALAVGAGVGGALVMGLQSLLAALLGLPNLRGIAFTYPTVGAILGSLSGAGLAAFQSVFDPERAGRRAIRDILGLTIAFAVAGMVFVPFDPDYQPLWSLLTANALVGLGMALPFLKKTRVDGHPLRGVLVGGAGAAVGGLLGRTVGVWLAPLSRTSQVVRLYLYPALNADTVNAALRRWGLNDLVSLSLLSILLQGLAALLLGLGLLGGMAAGQLVWKQLQKEEGDA